ncbi:DUF4232 domain-containing protein [Nocardia sp. NPDC059240]|uniref:DUF4232 domain-containing protein n=1 Tax=Nocardia sp. NPDC059240 TaxID=3346786 RepID=UPI0036BF8E64
MNGRKLHILGLIGAGLVAMTACNSATVTSGPTGGTPPTTTAPTGGGTPTTESSSAAAGIGECRADQLSVAIGKGGAAAMHSYFPLIFTNTGSTPCTMQGYPGVSHTNGPDGDPIGKPADRDTNTTPVTLVRLDPGATASAKIVALNGQGAYSSADCKPVPEKGLRIYPPDNKSSLFLDLPGTTCSNQSLTTLTVQAVQSGVAN